MPVRHAAVRSLLPSRVRTALGASVVGTALALGGAFTAHAASTSSDAPTEAQKAQAASPGDVHVHREARQALRFRVGDARSGLGDGRPQ
jgi:hypothetical protein